jgi:hypothetical protein
MSQFLRRLTGLVALCLPALLAAGPFAGPDLWGDPAPGVYQVRAEGTNLCLQRQSGAIRTQLPHLVLRACNTAQFDQTIEFVPNGTAAEPLTGASPVTWRIMTREKCLTAARGVVFGAPAIDELDCGTRNSDALLAHKGAADQTWRLRRNGASIEIVGGDGRCWTPQGAALRDGVAMTLETCGSRGGQRFEIFGQRSDVMAFDNADAAEEFGWLRLPSPRPVPARYRSMPGQNLPSGDYTTGIATANDRGAACAQACADDAQCKGFTWVDPRARGGTAMCYKKNALNAPVADNFTYSGIVRPR